MKIKSPSGTTRKRTRLDCRKGLLALLLSAASALPVAAADVYPVFSHFFPHEPYSFHASVAGYGDRAMIGGTEAVDLLRKPAGEEVWDLEERVVLECQRGGFGLPVAMDEQLAYYAARTCDDGSPAEASEVFAKYHSVPGAQWRRVALVPGIVVDLDTWWGHQFVVTYRTQGYQHTTRVYESDGLGFREVFTMQSGGASAIDEHFAAVSTVGGVLGIVERLGPGNWQLSQLIPAPAFFELAMDDLWIAAGAIVADYPEQVFLYRLTGGAYSLHTAIQEPMNDNYPHFAEGFYGGGYGLQIDGGQLYICDFHRLEGGDPDFGWGVVWGYELGRNGSWRLRDKLTLELPHGSVLGRSVALVDGYVLVGATQQYEGAFSNFHAYRR